MSIIVTSLRPRSFNPSTMHQSLRQLQAILDIYSGQPQTPADQILEHDQFR